MTVTGKDMMALGFEQGPEPGSAIDAVNVLGQMRRFGLAEVVDEIVPCGSIAAGEREPTRLGGKRHKRVTPHAQSCGKLEGLACGPRARRRGRY